MSCHANDPNLVLLAHGELGGPQRLLLEAHLRRCPRCQDQTRRYAAASTAIAGAVRGERLAPWSPPAPDPRSPYHSRPARWSLAFALLLALASVTAAAALWIPELAGGERSSQPIPNSAILPTDGCGKCHGNLPPGHPALSGGPHAVGNRE
jgi:hypothetical protein